MNKKDFICFLMGHADDETNEQLPYGWCPRCKKDYNEWVETLLNRYYKLRYKIIWWFRNHIYYKCQECHKTKIFMGKKINNHDECLPF